MWQKRLLAADAADELPSRCIRKVDRNAKRDNTAAASSAITVNETTVPIGVGGVSTSAEEAVPPSDLSRGNSDPNP